MEQQQAIGGGNTSKLTQKDAVNASRGFLGRRWAVFPVVREAKLCLLD